MFKELGPYLVPLVVLLIVLRRAGRVRRVRTQNIWLIPALGLLAVGSTLANEPVPSPVAIAIFIAAALLGAGAGYFRALHIQLSIDENGRVSSKATPIGTFLIVGFLALRLGLDYYFKGAFGHGGVPGGPPTIGAARHGVDLFRLTDAALIFSTLMSAAQRFETWRKAQPLLAEFRAAKAAQPPQA